jgi:archaellum component FlaC
MGRRLREEGHFNMDDLWKKEVQEMQSNIHYLQVRVKTLSERVGELTQKVTILGGDPKQLELDL